MKRLLMATGSALALSASAANFTFSDFGADGMLIPDGSGAGIADTRYLDTSIGQITGLRVYLDISGVDGWVGDLFVTLQHKGGYSVLLNRSGRDDGNGLGSYASGLQTWFDDSAADIRDADAASGATLTGTWSPDGRTTDPDGVLASDARGAMLSSFQGLDPNGEWILFLADVSGGAEMSLKSWGLEIETCNQIVPELAPGLLPAAVCCYGLLLLARRRRPEVIR